MRRVALFVLLCAALAGCGSLADLGSLQTRLQDAGYQNVSVFHRAHNGTDTLEVKASGSDPEKVAEIVWDTYPEHLDRLSITLGGNQQVYSEADLRDALGERQVTEKPDDDAAAGKYILAGLIVTVVVFLLLIILVVVLVRRSRRKAQQQPYNPPPAWPPAA